MRSALAFRNARAGRRRRSGRRCARCRPRWRSRPGCRAAVVGHGRCLLATVSRSAHGWNSRSGPIRSRRNMEWWRSNIHSPARWPMARERSSAFELVDRLVVGQLEQDHVVEVPAIGDVVPAQEPHAELLLVALDLRGKSFCMKNLKKGSRPRRTEKNVARTGTAPWPPWSATGGPRHCRMREARCR